MWKFDNAKCWQRCWVLEPLKTLRWEYQLVQLLWRTISWNIKVYLLHDPTSLLLSNISEKYLHTYTRSYIYKVLLHYLCNPQISINRKMDKLCFINSMEMNDMDKYEWIIWVNINSVEWEKQVEEVHIPFFFHY